MRVTLARLKNEFTRRTQRYRERLAITLLELSENFGTPDRRGVRLTVPARHRGLAELVGASPPRVTEHLIAFELGHMIARNDGRMVVKRERLERFLAGAHPAGLLTPRVKQAA